MAAVTPGRTEQPVQPRRAGAPPGRLDVQDVRARPRRSTRASNPDSTSYISAPFHYQPDPYTPGLGRLDLRPHLLGLDRRSRSATLRSDNTVYAQLTLDVGPENVAEMAHRLGVPTARSTPCRRSGSARSRSRRSTWPRPTRRSPPAAIYSKPMAIRKVVLAERQGRHDAGWGKPQRKRVISDGVAYEVTKILEENVLVRHRHRRVLRPPGRRQDGHDRRPRRRVVLRLHAAARATVWVGYPQGEIPMENVHGIAVAGGTFPATIWQLFMEAALGEHAGARLAQPRDSGRLEAVHAGPVRLELSATRATTTRRRRARPSRRRPRAGTPPAADADRQDARPTAGPTAPPPPPPSRRRRRPPPPPPPP